MILAAMIEEMRADSDRRHRAEIAKMSCAEVVAAHDAVCAVVEAAILGGHDLPPYAWHLDRVAALQEVRASLGPMMPPIEYHVPYVLVTHEDGVRLRYPAKEST